MSTTCRAPRASRAADRTRRCQDRVAGLVVTWLAIVNFMGVVQAQAPSPVVRVEEDWELVVGEPDANSTAPQATCVLSPGGNLEGFYASVEFNHRTQPEFSPGGVHLQTWQGETPLATHASEAQASLGLSGETVRWTQSMRLEDGTLRFKVEGDSATWDDFGDDGELKAYVSTSLDNLNGYSPDVSVANSGVSFASNRVQRLVLKEVRYYSANGLLWRDMTERVVYPK